MLYEVITSTDIRLDPGSFPLAVGNVSRQQAQTLMHLLVIPRTDSDFTVPYQQLRADLSPLGLSSDQPDGTRLMIDLTGDGHCLTAPP